MGFFFALVVLGVSEYSSTLAIMYFSTIISAIIASSSLAAALPSTPTVVRADAELRLIKTSEADPGVWVTEDQKIDDYVSKKIKFIDITDITVSDLQIL